jgi:type 1 glutamine amidotransferase
MRPGYRTSAIVGALWIAGLALLLVGSSRADDDGFVSIFDGKTLANWDGNPDLWRVEDGCITGETTPEKVAKPNTFLIWRGGEPADFELKVEYKIRNHNSGIQYRSFELPDVKWGVGGYQADFDGDRVHAGSIYGEKFRGMLAKRGDKAVIGENHKSQTVGSVGDSKELQSHIKENDWNEYHIIAQGNHFLQKINGVLMAELTDDDAEQRRASGILALQLHQGPPMKVQFRNVRLKQMGAKQSSLRRKVTAQPVAFVQKSGDDARQIVFVAGAASHGYGAHEHKAGCMLLASALDQSGLNVKTKVVTEGWPKDSSVFDGADCIVVYADGGKRHPIAEHLDELGKMMDKGVGLVCLHFAVEGAPGPSNDDLVKWIGGCFEINWSVNPHWKATYAKLPQHPITSGVQPFSINDEWYYHMRFADQGMTPILSDIPPQSTLERKDGTHSGNPAVREAIKRQEPQHMAWAFHRQQGRGFGFTGGHFHWNWGQNDFRKLVLNAIVWAAQSDVPEYGVPSKPLSVDDLMANQDEKVPANFDREAIQDLLNDFNKPVN